MTRQEAIERVRAISEGCVAERRGAISWLEQVPVRASLVWLPSHFAGDSPHVELARALLSPRIRGRINLLLRSPERGWALRAAYALCDRLAVPLACEDVLSAAARPHDGWESGGRGLIMEQPPVGSIHLSHTALGQPIPRWRGPLAQWARERGIRQHDLHISYTHDHDCHLTLAACAPELRGVGIDVVHLPRLRGERKGRAYLESFARHFMSDEELRLLLDAGSCEHEEAFRVRVAAHFSLMEAASKALGTGLKIGVGMGKPASLPKQSIGVRRLEPQVEFLLSAEAEERIERLGASFLTGYWAADAEYLVSAAILRDT